MGFLLIKWEEREGLKAKGPLIPFLPTQNRGGAQGRRRRRPIRPLRATAAAGIMGERRKGLLGFDSRYYLRLGWLDEVGRRGPAAAAALQGRGGDVWGWAGLRGSGSEAGALL